MIAETMTPVACIITLSAFVLGLKAGVIAATDPDPE
jgi:hypothetical protein